MCIQSAEELGRCLQFLQELMSYAALCKHVRVSSGDSNNQTWKEGGGGRNRPYRNKYGPLERGGGGGGRETMLKNMRAFVGCIWP